MRSLEERSRQRQERNLRRHRSPAGEKGKGLTLIRLSSLCPSIHHPHQVLDFVSRKMPSSWEKETSRCSTASSTTCSVWRTAPPGARLSRCSSIIRNSRRMPTFKVSDLNMFHMDSWLWFLVSLKWMNVCVATLHFWIVVRDASVD